MFYDALSANTVKITLTSRDMSEYAIKSECLYDRSAASKRSLTRFLKRFQNESSLFAGRSAERLFLEAFPSADGGCVMYVSTLGIEDVPAETGDITPVTLMCICGDLSDIARFGAGIADRVSLSSLYRTGEGWCLVMTAKSSDSEALSRLAEEYGELSDDSVDIACTAEHAVCVCAENAAAMLSGLV